MTGEKRASAPRAQVVAVGEAAGQDDAVDAVQRPVFVPERHRDLAEHLLERVEGVVVIERAGEGDDPRAHYSPTSKR